MRRAAPKVLLTAVLFGGVILLAAPQIREWLGEEKALSLWIKGFGAWAPAAYVTASALLMAVGVPRLLLCSVAGLAFGFGWGLAWSQAGTLLGSYLTFLFVRWGGRDWSLEHFQRLKPFVHALEERGVLAVLLIRQLPMSGFYNNLLLGVTGVSHRDFLLGSFLGFLPMGITASLLGAGLIQADAAHTLQYLTLAALSFALLGLGGKWWLLAQRRRARAS